MSKTQSDKDIESGYARERVLEGKIKALCAVIFVLLMILLTTMGNLGDPSYKDCLKMGSNSARYLCLDKFHPEG